LFCVPRQPIAAIGLVVAPCSPVAATERLVSEFRTADAGRKDVSIVHAPRIMGEYRIRILNVLTMLFPMIRSIIAPRKVPIGADVHIRAVE
jgi:hypothetical protein